MKRINICIFSPHFGGGYGAGYSIKKEVDELIKRGYQIFVIHSEKNIDNYRKDGAYYFYYQYSKIPIFNIFILKKNINRIIKKVLKNSIDIFYVQSPEFGLVRFKAIRGYPIIYFARSTMKGIEHNKPKEYWIDSLRRKFLIPILYYLEKRCLKFCDRVVVKSTNTKEELCNLYKVNSSKVNIISGGIDQKDFPKMQEKEIINFKSQKGLLLDEKIILFAGRIVPVKGLYYLVEALAEVVRMNKNIKLLIAGGSMYSRYNRVVEKLIRLLSLEKYIRFLGYVPQNLIYKYINISDVVVVPSTYEPFGMVNIQAVILGKPLITTDVVGSSEYIGNYPLLKVVTSRSSIDIARALKAFLGKREEFLNVHYKVDGLSWENMVTKLESIFLEEINRYK